MTVRLPQLFSTIPKRDYLDFSPNGRLDVQRVVRFLELSKVDVARISGVALASVRFDRKAPNALSGRLSQVAIACGLVAQFFEGDPVKTALWFKTPNPMLGNVSPRDMIRQGRFDKLRRFVLDALAVEAQQDGTPKIRTAGDAPSQAEGTAAGNLHPLIAVHRQRIEALCRHFGVLHLALFGSILRPDFDPRNSDIDMAVEFAHLEGHSPAHQYFDFKTALERLLDRPIDLVELSAMPQTRLRRIIERTQVPLYAEAA